MRRGAFNVTLGFQLGQNFGRDDLGAGGGALWGQLGVETVSIGRSRFGSGLDAGRLRNARGRARRVRSVLHCQMQRDGGDEGGGDDLSRGLSLRGFE